MERRPNGGVQAWLHDKEHNECIWFYYFMPSEVAGQTDAEVRELIEARAANQLENACG